MRTLALQLVEIGVHPVDSRVERRALADTASEQRKTAAGVARLGACLGQFIVLAGDGTVITALLAGTSAFLHGSELRSQLTADTRGRLGACLGTKDQRDDAKQRPCKRLSSIRPGHHPHCPPVSGNENKAGRLSFS